MTVLSHHNVFATNVGKPTTNHEPSDKGVRTIPIMTVRLCDGGLAGVRLVDVAQIDEIDTERLNGDGRHVWTWIGGRVVPLLGLCAHDVGRNARHTVLFFRDGGRSVGLAIGRALDVVTATAVDENAVVLNRHTVTLIRPQTLFNKAYAGLDLSAQILKPVSRYRRLRALLVTMLAHPAGRRPA